MVSFSQVDTICVDEKPKINKTNLLIEIKKQGILYPHIALSQAIYESGHFKSSIFVKNNNLFGMRLAKSRKTTAIGQRKKYATYNSWSDSVIDYKLWQDNIPIKYLKTQESYLYYIQKVYSITENYIHNLKKMK
jgi:flagellum-specific peptidoglycan hydrolase FlgJ